MVSLFEMCLISFLYFFVINLRKSQHLLPFAKFSRNVRSFRKFSAAIFAKRITHEHPGGGFLAQVLEALAEVDEQNVIVPQHQIKISQRSHTVKQ
jgi:hypothetical protein